MAATYLRNARIVTEADDFLGGVLFENGIISEVVMGTPERAGTVIEGRGRVVLPGLVDPHVHFSEPGRDWEGFLTGSRAAAAGGITTVVEMPLNAVPPTINVEALRLKLRAAGVSIVDYALWGGLVPGNLEEIAPLARAGVVAFKAFMCRGSEEFPHASHAVLRAGMRAVRDTDTLLAVHAEDEEMTDCLTRHLRKEGRRDPAAWGEARPVAAEARAIADVLSMAEATGAQLHVVHVSSAAGIDLISTARACGVRVTAETCPHYLTLTDEDLLAEGALAKCAPPLRSRLERDALWNRVMHGEVDVIASDHSPCPRADKDAGSTDIFEAWGGLSCLQSSLPAMITEGIYRRGLTFRDIARMMSANPARLMGLFPRKGTIALGSDADLVVVDPDRSYTLRESDLEYRHKHSIYVGRRFQGRVEATYLRGKLIYHEGKACGGSGFGKLLRRESRRSSVSAH